MAMGRNDRDRHETMWIASGEIVRGEGHIFYVALTNRFWRHGFDEFVESLVEKSGIFADEVGGPSVAPGIYFRMSLVGYFEGLSSERGIAWRCADSMSLREFVGYELTQETPDHSTLSRWRRKLPEKAHREVFEWVVQMAREEGILKGRKVAIDATTLEANAAMKTIVRKADGATYQDYLKKLAKAEGIENPTPKDLQRMARERRGETAILRILGFGRRAVLGVLLAEAALYGVLGAAAGMVLVRVFSSVIGTLMDKTQLQGLGQLLRPDVQSDLTVLLLGVTLAVVAGAVPAVTLSRRPVVQLLRETA